MSIKQRFDKLTPERKKIVVLGGASVVIALALWLFAAASDRNQAPGTGPARQKVASPESASLIGKSDGSLQQLGVPALTARVAELEGEVKRLKTITSSPVDASGGLVTPGVAVDGQDAASQRARAPLSGINPPPQRINVSPPSNAGRGAVINPLEPRDNNTDLQPPLTPKPPVPAFEIRTTEDREQQRSEVDDTASAASVTEAGRGATLATANAAGAPGARSTAAPSRPVPVAAGDRRGTSSKADDTEQVLPSGSMLSGVMLTGLDAPTSNQGRRDPIPALIRIKSEALLPNRFRLDLRECFLLASGYGDLSSERAYLRAERLSCVREDGRVIDTSLDATLQGRDGKAGLRGRVVHKNGQLIANSLMTGFLSGFSSALGGTRVPTLNISPTTTSSYESPAIGDVARVGALSGVGNAVGKIADYYLEMGRSIFPIIEIDAGQEVDFIVTGAQKLKLGVSGGTPFGRNQPTANLTQNTPIRRVTR